MNDDKATSGERGLWAAFARDWAGLTEDDLHAVDPAPLPPPVGSGDTDDDAADAAEPVATGETRPTTAIIGRLAGVVGVLMVVAVAWLFIAGSPRRGSDAAAVASVAGTSVPGTFLTDDGSGSAGESPSGSPSVSEGEHHASATARAGAEKPTAASATRSATKAPTAVGDKSSSKTAGPAKTTTPATVATTHPDWGTTVINSTTVLHPGENWHTNRITLGVQQSGNVVLSDENGKNIWATNTSDPNAQLVFQDDGNLVLANIGTGATVWSTRTDGHAGAVLVLQADANVTIQAGGSTLWASGTAR